MDLELAIYIAAGVALVAVLALIFVLVRSSRERQRLMREYEDAEDELQERLMKLSSEKAAVESKLAASEEFEARMREVQDNALKMQKEQHEKDLENMRDAFKALSAENSAVFKRQSAESIGELLKPIREKFTEFGDAVRESRKEALQQNAELKEHIRGVMDRSNAVGEEARNLANALTGYSKVQGDFGEMLLTDVLKNSGLQEGVHFFTQGVMTDSSGHEIKSNSGRTMIPDVMVFYPDDTTVIIDSKVSLNAYQEWMNAEKVEDRKRFAKAHVESVKKHVDELKTKDYASYIPADRRKVNYNLMFIPVEGAFRLMLEEDPLLWQVAKDNNVLIVSQMTLIIVLNMIQMAWKQANQEKNIAEVYKTAEELMSQLNGWMANYVKIGESLEKAMSSFEESTSKLKDSNQSVIKKIQKLEKLGLSPKKSQARIKTSGRTQGPESIIPASLSPTGEDLEAQ
ncbi:MAG: DNA recombination protein RmuC [Bacteroidales bacterium]|nr:DNA recombination protein RmuC [Bacteroidales bacterium]